MFPPWLPSLQTEVEKPLRLFPAEHFVYPGAQPVFYNSAPLQGKETRVFAWVSLPEGASPEHPVPGVVLAHGGGATALANWVKIWNSKGYAAISMDTCGGVPVWSESPYFQKMWPRHDHSGPAGWGRLADAFLPPEEQWPFHAMCAVLRGARLLAEMPEVDAGKIGITGISWGGFLATVCSGAIPEYFAFTIPVYGAGDFQDPQSKIPAESGASPEEIARWFQLWDPALVMGHISMPALFLTDAEDYAFPIDGWNRSIELCPGKCVRRSIRCDYPHNHTISFDSHTIYDFAGSVLAGRPVPELGRISVPEPGRLAASLAVHGRTLQETELYFTRASGRWVDRRWSSVEATCSDVDISAALPDGTTAAFFSIRDGRGCIWTSDLYLA